MRGNKLRLAGACRRLWPIFRGGFWRYQGGVASLLFLTSACSADVRQPADASCVVAQIGGEVLSSDDVEQLRALVRPAPSGDSAKRWAIDVALAQWDRAGRIRDASPGDMLRSYRELLAEVTDLDSRRHWRTRVAAAADLREGTCWPQ